MEGNGLRQQDERRGFRHFLRRMWGAVRESFSRRPVQVPAPESPSPQPLRRVLLNEGVSRTLLEEYARHRRSERGDEETGWLLVGLRRGDEVVVQATLP